MLDNRIHTFLMLCQEMNYRKTAEQLLMTQPAVTQHIHALEALYGCKLFDYEGKKLSKTTQGAALEAHARAVIANEKRFRKQISTQDVLELSVGATKTIGDYMASEQVMDWLRNPNISLTFTVDNTEHLFTQLHNFQLDFLMIEGYFDKSKYQYKPICTEQLVGICAPTHPFAGREVPIDEVFCQHLLLREHGSGTRMVLEQALAAQNYSIAQFARTATISSIALIEQAVCAGLGISFVYRAIPQKNKALATFTIAGMQMSHELNYVFLKDAKFLAVGLECQKPVQCK